MKVLLLTPTPDKLKPIIETAGDEIVDMYLQSPDLVVSYNHRKILRSELQLAPHINLHISLLPYNRGADPNFWSWYDNTPKGVSIHYMDSGIDTGPVIVQQDLGMVEGGQTLRSSYNTLQTMLLHLFEQHWATYLRDLPMGMKQKKLRVPQATHRRADARPILDSLPLGWDTPVSTIKQLGLAARQQTA